MANVSEGTFQDTGNPVLDSLVNLLAGSGRAVGPAQLETTHAVLLKLAQREPGGLRRWAQTMAYEAQGSRGTSPPSS